MTSRQQQPTWDQYERGAFSRTGSVSSFGNRSARHEGDSLLGRSVDSNQDDVEWPQHLRRRRYGSLTPSSILLFLSVTETETDQPSV